MGEGQFCSSSDPVPLQLSHCLQALLFNLHQLRDRQGEGTSERETPSPQQKALEQKELQSQRQNLFGNTSLLNTWNQGELGLEKQKATLVEVNEQ